MRYKDKVAVVTGGSKGIGGATSQAFAAEGAKVAVLDIEPPDFQAKDSEILYIIHFSEVGGGYGGYDQDHEFFGYRQSI